MHPQSDVGSGRAMQNEPLPSAAQQMDLFGL
jgi:hypothetical protein